MKTGWPFANLNRIEEAILDYGQSSRLQPSTKAYHNRATT